MDRHPNDMTTDEDIDAWLEEARHAPEGPRIIEAAYHSDPGLEFLMLKLKDGRRLLIPREELSELKDATPEQAKDLFIGPKMCIRDRQRGQRLAKPGLSGLSSNSSSQTTQVLIGKGIFL